MSTSGSSTTPISPPTPQPSPPSPSSRPASGQDSRARRSESAQPLAAAKTPVGPGLISALGLVWALLLTGLGVLGVQAALVYAGLLTGTSWLTWLIQRLDGLAPAAWMLAAGVVLVLLGLWLLVAALRPRPRTAVAVKASTGVFLKPRDLARLAVAAADDVDGVQDAKASATRGKVTLRITGTGDPQLSGRVTSAVEQHLTGLANPIKVTVRAHGGKS